MLHKILATALTTHPDRPMIESDGTWTTASELERMVSRLASGLVAAGLEEGDRVAVLLPNSLELVACYLACFRMQFVMVPINYFYQPIQTSYALGHSGASLLICHKDRMGDLEKAGVLGSAPRVVVVGGDVDGVHRPFESLLGSERTLPVAEPHEDTPATIMYTSGTTSRPNGVILTHGALTTGIRRYQALIHLTADDVTLIATYMFAPLALRCLLLPTLWVGGRVSLLKGFAPGVCVDALQRPPAKTVLALLPGALGQVVGHPGFPSCDFSGLRLCLSGGDHVPVRLQESFEKMAGVPITVQCGSTETGPYAMNPPFGRKKLGSIGLPVRGVQVVVVDNHGQDLPTGAIGEMWVSGPTVMDGYWNNSAMTRKVMQNQWIRTGDLGRFDEDGYLWFMGRIKELIYRAGCKIPPKEVETTLAKHPSVLESCVIGVPDAVWGEVAHAHVVLQPGTNASQEELRAFLESRIADYMIPSQIHFVREMPLKGPGKVDRDLLRMRAIIAPLMEQVPFFNHATDAFLRDIIPRLEVRPVLAGEFLIHEGDIGDDMYFLTKGQVEVFRGIQNQRLGVLREGSFFGEVAILRDVPRIASVRALTAGEVYVLRRTGVLELSQSHPAFGQHLGQAAKGYTAAMA